MTKAVPAPQWIHKLHGRDSVMVDMDLRRQLFGRYRRRHSCSRSRNKSPYRHRRYEEWGHGSCGHGRRYDDMDKG
ncbi:hypothetical protein Tco_0620848 [Tanacetum coccineum]